MAWISSRGDQLAAVFTLLALRVAWRDEITTSSPREVPQIAIKRRRISRILLIATFTALACLGKESGAVIPLVLLAACVTIPSLRNRIQLGHIVAGFVAVGAFLILRHVMLGPLQGQTPLRGDSWFSNLAYALFGLAYQTSLLFRPWFHNVDFQGGFFTRFSPSMIRTWAITFPLLLVGLFIVFRRRPLARLGLLLFLVALLPTSSILFPMKSLVNERYLYFAMTGAGLLVASLLPRWDADREGRFFQKRLTFPLILVILAVLGIFSFLRSLDWTSPERLWTATLETNPGSVKARIGLASVRFNAEEFKDVLRLAKEAHDLSAPGTGPRYDAAHYMAKAHVQLGNPEAGAEELRKVRDEVETLNRVTASRKRLIEIARHLWAHDTSAKCHVEAERSSAFLLAYGGRTAKHLLLAGVTAKDLGKLEEAKALLHEAITHPDAQAEAYITLGEVYGRLGDNLKAKRYLKEGLLRKQGTGN